MGKKLADIIEEMILQQLAVTETILFSRNQMAHDLNCAPSQISYVLQSRFSQERGFVCQSRRGSGGFVKIARLILEEQEQELYGEQQGLRQLLKELLAEASELNDCQIQVLRALDKLLEQEACTRTQLNWIRGALVHIVR